MTTIETPVALGHIETTGDGQPVDRVAIGPSEYTPCASYQEARNLAGRLRYEGQNTRAVFHSAMNCWCVREHIADRRARGGKLGGGL